MTTHTIAAASVTIVTNPQVMKEGKPGKFFGIFKKAGRE
jgi:hypothetical protein